MSSTPGGGLARQSAEPVHQQLSSLLRELSKRLGPGGRLPTEFELMEQHGVSRATVRRAVDTLVDEGLLQRQRAKGTFVRPDRMVHTLDHLRPFIAMYTEAGEEPEGTLLVHEWVSDAEKLPGPIAHHAEVLHVRRLYRAAGLAPAIADIFIPKEFALQITRADLEEHPVYQVIQNKVGLAPAYADVVVRSQALTEEYDALECPVGSPLLVLQRTTYDAHDVLLECTMLYLRPDSIELQLRVQAESTQPDRVDYDFHGTGPRLAIVDNRNDQATP